MLHRYIYIDKLVPQSSPIGAKNAGSGCLHSNGGSWRVDSGCWGQPIVAEYRWWCWWRYQCVSLLGGFCAPDDFHAWFPIYNILISLQIWSLRTATKSKLNKIIHDHFKDLGTYKITYIFVFWCYLRLALREVQWLRHMLKRSIGPCFAPSEGGHMLTRYSRMRVPGKHEKCIGTGAESPTCSPRKRGRNYHGRIRTSSGGRCLKISLLKWVGHWPYNIACGFCFPLFSVASLVAAGAAGGKSIVVE